MLLKLMLVMLESRNTLKKILAVGQYSGHGYMIGSGNNKDCEEWFFDRIVRDRPVPIPRSGTQITNVAHVRDLSSMLILAVENPDAATHNIFNIVSDRAVTLIGMAKLCAQAAGRPVNIVHYDAKAVGIDAKKAFPFRKLEMTCIIFY